MADNDEDVWRKLKAYDKVQHKNWKARKAGYEELIKEIPGYALEPEKLKKYCPFLKDFVTEQNELSRILSSEVARLILDSATTKDAAKHVSAVVDGIVQKCFTSKPKTKESAIECCLQFIEHEKAEEVCTTLITGTQNKNPKIAIASIETLTQALSAFGSKIISLKPCFAEMPKLFQHRDKNVRSATKNFFIEAYCWVGASVKLQLERVPKIEQNIKECEEGWKDLKTKSKQKRFFKSQQAEREAAAETEDAGDEVEEEEEETMEVDIWEYAPEVNLLSELAKCKFGESKLDYSCAMASKKWKERGEVLEKMCDLLKVDTDGPIKLAKGEYISLMTDIKTLIKKDTNVLLVIKALKIVNSLAHGMRDSFKNFGPLLLQEIFARFKEKKASALEAGRQAADAISAYIKFPDVIMDNVLEAIEDKNPGVRTETMLFMYRCSKSKKIKFPKTIIKEFMTKVAKNIEHSDKGVRDAAYKVLAMMSTKLEAKIMATFIADFKDDRTKLYQAAIDELKGSPAVAPASTSPKVKEVKPKEPEKVAPKKVVKKVDKKKKTKKEAPANEPSESSGPPAEAEMDDDSAVDICVSTFGEGTTKKVQDKNWKTRLEGLQEMTSKLNTLEKHEVKTQAIFRLLSLAPGFKDTNFQCNQEKFKIIRVSAANPALSQTCINIVFNYCLDKIADVKCGAYCKEALSGMADSVSLAYMAAQVLPNGNKLKSVKNAAECWSWFAGALPEFGFGKLDVKMFVDESLLALANSNAGIRTKAIEAIAAVIRFVAPLRARYSTQKEAIQSQIDDALKAFDGPAPPPTRGPVLFAAIKAQGAGDQAAEEDEMEDDGMEDLIPRTDVSASLGESLLEKLDDKNWKVRKEGLDEVKSIFEKNKFITPDLGDSPLVISKRLGDVNKVLVQTTIEIVVLMAAALGAKGAKIHVKSIVIPLISALNDSKIQIREKGTSALSAWHELVPLRFWFDDESIAGVLSDPKKVHLRYTFLNWLSGKLPEEKKVPKDGLENCITHIYSCMEDRDGKVREAAAKSLLGFMLHLGYPRMTKLCKSAKTREELDKVKENMPKVEVKAEVIDAGALLSAATVKPKKTKKAAPMEEEEEEKKEAPTKEAPTKKKILAKPRPGTKKVEEEDLGEIIIGTEKAKTQRIKDDAKLKSLKWFYEPGTACRKELVDQLNRQISENFGPKFVPLMIKADSTALGKTISILQEQPLESSKQVVDIILRWMTIRMNEKNTTILTKVLNWLQDLINNLKNSEYNMQPFEAMALLPHLISKMGESRQEIRSVVIDTLFSMERIFSNKRIFEFLLLGAKSKNSRQRCECLTHCATMISRIGIEVAGPPKQQAFKEIAAHIADKDQTVRSSAMNCLVAVHKIIGDDVYNPKMIGRLGDKEDSYLRERIKRATPLESGSAMPPPVVPTKGPETPRRGTITLVKNAARPQVKRNVIAEELMETVDSGRFQLDIPAPAKTQISSFNLADVDFQHIVEGLPKTLPKKVTGSVAKEECIDKCLVMMKHFGMSDKQLGLLILKLQSEDDVALKEGMKTLGIIFKLEPPLKIPDTYLCDIVMAIASIGTNKVVELMKQGDDRYALILSNTMCNLSQKILRGQDYGHKLTSPCLMALVNAMLEISTRKEATRINQTLCDKFTAVLCQILSDIIVHCNFTEVTIALCKCIAFALREEKDNWITKLNRLFYNFCKKVMENQTNWKMGEIARIYSAIEGFLEEFPRTHGVYKKGQDRFESLRTIVTFASRFTRNNPEMMKHFLQTASPKKSHLIDLVRKELVKKEVDTSDEKENLPSSVLMQAQKALSKIKKDETHDKGIEALHHFTLQNPNFDLTSVLSSEHESLQKYIRTKLLGMSKGVETASAGSPASAEADMEKRIEDLRQKFGLNTKPRNESDPSADLELEKANPKALIKTSPTRRPAIDQSRLDEYRKRLNDLKKSN